MSEQSEQTEEQKKATLAKRRQRRRQNDEVFEAFMGLAYGLVVGVTDSIVCMQLVGAPHSLEHCRIGKYCPLHGEKALPKEEGKADEQ